MKNATSPIVKTPTINKSFLQKNVEKSSNIRALITYVVKKSKKLEEVDILFFLRRDIY